VGIKISVNQYKIDIQLKEKHKEISRILSRKAKIRGKKGNR
jgi:hypothetical protein